METRLRALMRQGERAMRLGKQQAAEEVFREAVVEFPDSARAWLNLSQVVSSEEEKAEYFQRAKLLDPDVVLDDGGTEKPVASPAEAFEKKQSSQLDVLLDQSRENLKQAVNLQPPAAPVKKTREETAPAAAKPEGALACANHPDVVTTLRCNRCNKPICQKCAIRTPVGYRCKSCIREQQGVFYSAFWFDYLFAALVSIPLAAFASYIIFHIGWLTIFIAPFAGLVIAEAVRLVTRRRRGRWLPLVVSICIIAGSLPGVGIWLIVPFLTQSALPIGALVWQGVYLFLAVGSAYYRVK